MTILPSLRERVSIIRRVTVDGTDVTITPVDPAVPVQCSLAPPPLQAPTGEASPRESRAGVLRYADGARGPLGGPLNAGDRVQTATGAVLEVLSPSEALRQPRRVVGWDASVQPVSLLYPLAAEVQAQGGEVLDQITIATWTTTESHEDRGSIEEVNAEAPPEHFDLLNASNRWLVLGGVRHHVVDCTMDPQAPRAVLTLRRVDG